MKLKFLRDNNSTWVSLINWCSAVSIWLMTYATLERVHVIRSPFGANTRTAVSMRFIATLILICITAFILTGQGDNYAITYNNSGAHYLRDSPIFDHRPAVRAVLIVRGRLGSKQQKTFRF